MFIDQESGDEAPPRMTSSSAVPEFPRLSDCVRDIEAEYQRLGHSLGWRFVTGPAATFARTTEVALITLNPGGDRDYPEHPSPYSEAGSCYWAESWGSHQRGTAPLQRQLQALFAALASNLGVRRPVREWVESSVLTAHFVPFRSSRFHHLHRADESVAFSRQLWSRILATWVPRTVLTIDSQAFAAFRDLLVNGRGFRVAEAQVFETGWGKYRADLVTLVHPDTGQKLALGRLPHLSTFKLFSRAACATPVSNFLKNLVQAGK